MRGGSDCCLPFALHQQVSRNLLTNFPWENVYKLYIAHCTSLQFGTSNELQDSNLQLGTNHQLGTIQSNLNELICCLFIPELGYWVRITTCTTTPCNLPYPLQSEVHPPRHPVGSHLWRLESTTHNFRPTFPLVTTSAWTKVEIPIYNLVRTRLYFLFKIF